jgi:O-antigen biosynthesis protein
MKYPFVIFYRYDKYFYIDNIFVKNKNNIDCSIFITSDYKDLNNLYNANYQLLLTFGDTKEEYTNEISTILSKNIQVRHIHLSKIDDIVFFNNYVNNSLIEICAKDRIDVRPIFSVFTTSYNSYEKILRAYKSLLEQTLKDWEWVIIDDSPDDNNFSFLRNNICNDQRIRIYRRHENNGSIGNVKNEAVSLCRGKYILELDHDDEILPFVLEESAEYFDKNNDVGFIYMDFINIYENGNNFKYGDFICKGYGGYYSQKYDGKWRYVYITPNINNITLSHLVCCPNHPRIWRRDILIKLGNYCEFLPICDDYEIILRTALNTKMVKIHKLGYIQYMNESNNNFSLIRNSEINRIGPKFISPNYYNIFNIHEKMKELNAYEDEKYVTDASQIWKRDTKTYQHNYCNIVINNDYDTQYCIIGIDSLMQEIDKIKKLYEDKRNDFILLDNKHNIEYLWQKLEELNFDKFKCYVLHMVDNNTLINYFNKMYLIRDKQSVIINTTIQSLNYNTTYSNRYEIINMNSSPENAYLEIGVEYGHTIQNTHFLNKIGVDPDPKCNLPYICKTTSDDYFKNINVRNISSVDNNISNNKIFDIIFIDGMHQVEYVLKDLNNSIKYLNENGKILLDDIIPFNYNEQRKIPIKHYYENGILKYGEPWTGDVWKIIYHLLLKYKSSIKTFKIFHNPNYRGIGCISINKYFQIDENDLEEINSYEYFEDFNNYIKLLQEVSIE